MKTVNSSRHHLREWAKQAAAQGRDPSFRVLDAGAGDAPYRDLFAHVSYETADLRTVDKPYARIDHACDLADMPMPDGRYDLIFCTQTLEHVKDPIGVLREFRRLLRPGGQAWLTAPLFYAEHEAPYDFYRYTQHAWRHMADEAGLRVAEIAWLEGYYGTLSYQLSMAATELPASMLLWRLMLGRLSRSMARRDLHNKVTDRGMCKNYRVRLVKDA